MSLWPSKYYFLKQSRPRYKWFSDPDHLYLKKKSEDILDKHLLIKKNKYRNCKLVTLDFNFLKYLVINKYIDSGYQLYKGQLVKKSYNQFQYINRLNHEDHRLLEKSLKYKVPKEIMRLSIMTESDEIFYSKYIKGSEGHVGDKERIEKWIHTQRAKLIQNGHSIKSIHIDHVHPTLEIMTVHDGGYSFITNGLGNKDLYVAKSIADHLNETLIISAIAASGVKYSAIFQN